MDTNEFIFNAFNRTFIIYLKKSLNVLSNDVSIEIKYSNKPSDYILDLYTTNYYVGYVDSEKFSNVLLYYDNSEKIVNNKTIIYAKIELENDTYYIEPSNTDDKKFLIYKSNEVKSEIFNNNAFK